MDMRDTAPQHEPSDIQTRLHAILDEHGLDLAHTARVEAEARALAAAPGLDDPSLEDLEALPFVTIDYEQSKDLDQALLIERTGAGGGYLVRYALADAAHRASGRPGPRVSRRNGIQGHPPLSSRQGWLALATALSTASSFRMQALSSTLGALPRGTALQGQRQPRVREQALRME